MDTSATTAFSRGTFSHRDHGAPRRAYLDTYARNRNGNSAETEGSAGIPEAMQQQVAVEWQPVQTPVEEVPVPREITTEDYITLQPSVDGFALPQPQPAPAPVAIQPQQPTAPISDITPNRKNYIDTLSRRHQEAVNQAPAAEETVIAPMITSETEALFDEPDPETEARIEANLNALYPTSLAEIIDKNALTPSASASHVRTIVASAAVCGILAVGMFSFLARYDSQPVTAQPIGSPVIEVETSNTQKPSGTPKTAVSEGPVATDPSHPVRMVISSIGVNAPVEGLGTTPEGLIAVPKSYGVVGWYNKGSVPGKAGPAVLVGHYTGGNKGVFDNLKNLKTGDLITTTNGRGESYTYKVTVMNEYDRDKVPMTELFKKSDDSRLQIITCSGKWQANNYTQRLVVTAELVR